MFHMGKVIRSRKVIRDVTYRWIPFLFVVLTVIVCTALLSTSGKPPRGIVVTFSVMAGLLVFFFLLCHLMLYCTGIKHEMDTEEGNGDNGNVDPSHQLDSNIPPGFLPDANVNTNTNTNTNANTQVQQRERDQTEHHGLGRDEQHRRSQYHPDHHRLLILYVRIDRHVRQKVPSSGISPNWVLKDCHQAVHNLGTRLADTARHCTQNTRQDHKRRWQGSFHRSVPDNEFRSSISVAQQREKEMFLDSTQNRLRGASGHAVTPADQAEPREHPGEAPNSVQAHCALLGGPDVWGLVSNLFSDMRPRARLRRKSGDDYLDRTPSALDDGDTVITLRDIGPRRFVDGGLIDVGLIGSLDQPSALERTVSLFLTESRVRAQPPSEFSLKRTLRTERLG
ncbi:hypothetical protein INS49_014494 [Diaporthe citri]|uniref:uncharacterized protein n=1 Tax=Diaporthe citri TaxID=83186 RepID=UPI001C7E69A8|nr:uncharacterized protein INS49_014494 [Diaporthe citri]KAG6356620.1 hypothetical protein INS49_014494 [Diaporthe citri]